MTGEVATVRAKRFDADRLLALGTEDLRGLDAPRRVAALLVAITCAGALLRFATLSQSIWYDESFSIRETSGSFGQMLSSVVHHEGSPPFYFAVLWVWRQLFGNSAVDMRTLSALAGTITIPLAFVGARRLVGDRAALIVAALLASSPGVLYYSQELRMYAVLILLSALALACFAALIQSPTKLLFATWAIVSVLAMTTHYFVVLVVIPQAAWLVARWWREPVVRRQAVVATIPVLVAGVALLILLEYQQSRIWPYTSAVLTSPFVFQPITAAAAGASDSLPQMFQQLMIGPGGPLQALMTVLTMFFLLFGVLLLVRGRADSPARRGAELLIALLGTATFVMIVMFTDRAVVEGRYFLPCWIPAMTVVAAGLALWSRRGLAVAVTLSVCAIGVAIGLTSFLVPRLASREDTRGVARALGIATRSRVIAIDQKWDVPPLVLYRSMASLYTQRTVTTKELDVVLMPERNVPAYSYSDRPTPEPIRNLPSGLNLRQLIKGDTFWIERYVSNTPVRVRLYPRAGSFSLQYRFLHEPAGASISSL